MTAAPADVIAAHLRENLWSMDAPFSNQSDAYYQGGEDALTALVAAGFAVVKLPDPDGVEEDSSEHVTWWAGPEAPFGCSVARMNGQHHLGILVDFPEWITDPDTARSLALALLSGAAAAEATYAEPEENQ